MYTENNFPFPSSTLAVCTRQKYRVMGQSPQVVTSLSLANVEGSDPHMTGENGKKVSHLSEIM